MNREIDGQLRIHLEKEFGSIERIQPQVGMGYGHVVTISTKRYMLTDWKMGCIGLRLNTYCNLCRRNGGVPTMKY